MEEDFIIISDYCEKSNVDPAFMVLLEEEGLIEINIIEGIEYIQSSQVDELEIYIRLYYDLSINVEGIDAIHNLLRKVLQLRKEIEDLKNRLSIYESDDIGYIDDMI